MVRAALANATTAALAVFSAMPAATAAASSSGSGWISVNVPWQDLNTLSSAVMSVPVTVGFEPGLTSAQISQLTAMVPDIIAAQTQLSGAAQSDVAPSLTTGGLARRSCTDQTACYASTCWVPFLGVSCIGCSSISC